MTLAVASTKPIRVLVADDHPLIIEGLTASLGRDGIAVVGSATTAADVLSEYLQCAPEVIVLDVRFGTGTPSGLDAARETLSRYPGVPIVFYSQFDQDELVSEAYGLGGMGFVTKNKPTAVLAEAIKRVRLGKTHFLPEIAERLALLKVKGDSSPKSKLDARELEVFRLMAVGRTNAEIAEAMALSPKTISVTSQLIKEKLGVQRPAEITRLAFKHGLIEP
jgi:two-component system, NarL family, invasion response regulator UvrY